MPLPVIRVFPLPGGSPMSILAVEYLYVQSVFRVWQAACSCLYRIFGRIQCHYLFECRGSHVHLCHFHELRDLSKDM